MNPRAEQLIEAVKSGLSNLRIALKSNTTSLCNSIPVVKAYMGYVDQSGIMYDPRRIDEQVWILNEVQNVAYFDQDTGGIPEVAVWCEKGWNRVLSTDPCNVGALAGLGSAWLAKAQYWLARIDHEERRHRDIDDLSAERRLHTENYLEARAVLQPAVDFFARAVENSRSQGQLTGPLLEKAAEASMSLGNVSSPRTGRKYFKDSILALQAAANIGHRLPRHLQQWMSENEWVLRI